MENNHNFQKENSDNFRIICVLGFWCLSPLEVSTKILKILTSVGMNLCLCDPHFHRAGG